MWRILEKKKKQEEEEAKASGKRPKWPRLKRKEALSSRPQVLLDDEEGNNFQLKGSSRSRPTKTGP